MSFLRRHALAVGIGLMFLLTWPFYARLGLVVGYGLSAACLVVTALLHGSGGVRRLLRRFLIWRVGGRWYTAALLGPWTLAAITLVLLRAAGVAGASPARTVAAELFGANARLWLFAVPFFALDVLTNGEELAWRGFVLPRFQARANALVASLLVGVIWGVWHLPKFVQAGDPAAVLPQVAHAVILSIFYTWIYNSTRGSLLLATLLHASFNTAYVFLGSMAGEGAVVEAVRLAVELSSAGAVTRMWGPVALSRLPPVVAHDLEVTSAPA